MFSSLTDLCSEESEILEFYEDDPYYNEDAAFLRALQNGNSEGIQSPYEDSINTYRLTWAIRKAASNE